MYKNFLFDLYGTIVDIHTNEGKTYLWKKLACYMSLQGALYEPAELKKAYQRQLHEAATAAFLQKKKEEAPQHPMTIEDVEPELGDVISALYAQKKICASKQQIADWALMFRTISLEYVCLFDGAKDMLKTLRQQGRHVYLLSNAQCLLTRPEMEMLGIYDLFEDVFYSADIGFKKPSWYFYHALTTKHNLVLEDTVMVGNDWIADAWGAANYGLDSLYVHTKQSTEITGKLPESCQKIKEIKEVILYS